MNWRGLSRSIKRLIDVVVSAVALLALSPIFAIVALVVAIEDGRPVLFRQIRAGQQATGFKMIKFRSMRNHHTPVLEMGPVRYEHPLVTKTGRPMRRLRIDELPQLVNVLRGEMSLVGPRPALPEQAARYDEFERRRLEIRPGLTGWAQVNGNDELTWPERILLDIWYIDHWSLSLDLRILVRTAAVVVRGEHRNPQTMQQARVHASQVRTHYPLP